MNPTEYFRFVERPGPPDLDGNRIGKVRILQQWWESEKMIPKPPGEWRDVPLLDEDSTPPHDLGVFA